MLPQVIIIGRPNVGKSTLFNRLVGKKLALVVDQRQLLADQPVEQRRLADVGPADDHDLGEGGGHSGQVAVAATVGKRSRHSPTPDPSRQREGDWMR